MKILKIFGVVVGIHVFALILIFANPGCTSTNPPAPAAVDTVAKADAPAPAIAVPAAAAETSPIIAAPMDSPVTPAPATDPAASPNIHYSPTRPNTAAAETLVAQPVADVTPATTYTVVHGDSLWSIAKKHHISYKELAIANSIKTSAIVRPGQKLIIPSKALPAEPVDSGAKPAVHPKASANGTSAHRTGESVKHVVKPGETIGSIARKYQVRARDIEVANTITDPKKIRPGMVLVIPGWQAPAHKAAATPAAPTPPPQATPADSPVQPAPVSDLDAGVKPQSGEPPVIDINGGSSAPKK